MPQRLILVDYENVHKVDLSLLDESFRAIIFVGVQQTPPKAPRQKSNAARNRRVDYQKINGMGKNALDFHIAFHLGRVFETAPETICFVLSKDKGFDPLISHLNQIGLNCRRVSSLDELAGSPSWKVESIPVELTTCQRCLKSSTIEHLGGRWCTNCGRFALPPETNQLPCRDKAFGNNANPVKRTPSLLECDWCGRQSDIGDGIYDDGEMICSSCLVRFTEAD